MEKIDKKSDKDLQKELKESREKLMKIQLGRGAAAKPHEQKALRRTIARILTELNKRQRV